MIKKVSRKKVETAVMLVGNYRRVKVVKKVIWRKQRLQKVARVVLAKRKRSKFLLSKSLNMGNVMIYLVAFHIIHHFIIFLAKLNLNQKKPKKFNNPLKFSALMKALLLMYFLNNVTINQFLMILMIKWKFVKKLRKNLMI
jgi:hypothetical protein